MRAPLVAALLAAACASAPQGYQGPITGRATFDGRTFTCSRAGLFAEAAGSAPRWLGDPGIRAFALAADPAGLLVGGGTPAQSGELVLCGFDGRAQSRVLIADDLVYAVALAPNAPSAAAGCADGRVVLVSLPALAEAKTRWRHAGPVVGLAFSPDGELLASGGQDGVVRLGPAGGDAAPQQLIDHTAAVLCLAWSGDGARFASGARDGKLRVHDRTGRLLHTWQRLGGAVQEVAFDGRSIRYVAAGAQGQPERSGVVDVP